MDLNITGGAYNLEAPVSVQECINLFIEIEKEGSQARRILRRFPGLKLFVNIGNGRIRGMKTVNGVLYVVAGTSLYSVSIVGVATSLGTVPGSNLASMAHDGTNLVIVIGTTAQYTYDGSTFSTVTLPFASSRVLFLDTYMVHQRPDTNEFFVSAAQSVTSYSALDKALKSGQPDNIVTIITSNRDLILLGARTTETWRITPNADFPFLRQEGTFQERGALGLNAPVEMDNDVYYLGDDRVVYRMSGYTPRRISHHAIEKWLDEQSITDVDNAIGMTITHQGHYWYILSLANSTWVYDATVSALSGSDEWVQLLSLGQLNWRVEVTEEAYGRTYCGGPDGIIYQLDPDTLNENGERQLKRRTSPYYHNERHPLSFNRLDLAIKEGVATSGVANPEVFLEISKDWGRTWGNRRSRSMGETGNYNQKVIWRRNGASRTSVFRITVTDDVDVVIPGQWADVATGPG